MNLSFRLGMALPTLFASVHVFAACERNLHGAFEDLPCAAAAFSEAHKDLEVAIGQLLRQLDPKSMQTFVSAQEAWERQQAAEASIMLGKEGNGSAGRLVVANSSEHAIRARILELHSWPVKK